MKSKYIPWLIIAVLLIIIFLLRECGCPKCPEIAITHDTITIIQYDTIPHIDTLPIPVPKTVILPGDTIRYVDSTYCMELARTLFTHNIYDDILQDDTSAYIRLKDTVYRNRLLHREITFKNRRPTKVTNIINTTQIKNPVRNKLFVGISIGRSLEQFTIGPNLMFIDKKDRGYSLMYDPFYKDWYTTLYFKIKIKK